MYAWIFGITVTHALLIDAYSNMKIFSIKIFFILGALYPTCQTVVSLEGRRKCCDFIDNVNNEDMNAALSQRLNI